MFLSFRYRHASFRGVEGDGVRLPSNRESVSAMASSGGMVYKAFRNGLMYGDQQSLMAGGGLFLGLIVVFMFTQHLFIGGENMFSSALNGVREGQVVLAITNIVWLIAMLAALPLLMLFVIGDLVGFRFDRSALFDRQAGKVHVFSDKSTPIAPWRYTLKTYDWACVHAEIDTMAMLIDELRQPQAGLRVVIMDQPGGHTVVDHFLLGISVPAQHIQPLLDTWEHVRRFMQHEGPLFASPQDRPNSALGRKPLWRHLLAWPAEYLCSGPDLVKLGWRRKNPFIAFGAVLWFFSLPVVVFTFLWGFLPWLSGLAKRDPVWPADILASVGGASLSGKELDAWRDLVPGKADGQQGSEAAEQK